MYIDIYIYSAVLYRISDFETLLLLSFYSREKSSVCTVGTGKLPAACAIVEKMASFNVLALYTTN